LKSSNVNLPERQSRAPARPIGQVVFPGILTVAIISGLNIWNEFLISSTFLQSHDQQTAVVRFYTLGGQYSSDWGEIMAAAIIIVAPAVGFFLLMQRRFIQGMAAESRIPETNLLVQTKGYNQLCPLLTITSNASMPVCSAKSLVFI
jgi:hypothetical protein